MPSMLTYPTSNNRNFSVLGVFFFFKASLYRARNWTFDKNHFLVSSSSSFQNGSSSENCVKKLSFEVGWYKMPSKLLGCIGFLYMLYKVVHITGRFSVFIFTNFFPF